MRNFLDYTEGIPSPEIFRRWVAISTIAGALERRTYLWTAKRLLFPNLFVLLVSPPGIGKTVAIEEGQDLWTKAGKFNVAPGSMTGKGIVDQLQSEDGERSYIDANGEWQRFHSMLIPSAEFGTLIQGQDLSQLSILNSLFDCGPMYEERTRGLGLVSIEKPHISLMAGTQPSYLGEIFPESAYGMGFTSRLVMVYSADPIQTAIFDAEEGRDQKQRQELADYLKTLAGLQGQFIVEDHVKQQIEAWWEEGCPPVPDHSKLAHYNTRRITHCLKLCMAFSAARDTEMVIQEEDFTLAKNLLLEAEAKMPEIFKEISASSDHSILEEANNFVWQEYFRDKQPIKEHEIVRFLQQRVPLYKINDTIEGLINGGYVQKKGGAPGKRLFIPEGVG